MIELNRIYNEDCLEGMKRIPDKSVDLVVTDPPYLMDYQSGRRVASDKFRKIDNDKNADGLIRDFFAGSYRVMKDDTAIYAFCSWHHIDLFKVECERWFKLKNILVWNKNNHGSGDLEGGYAPKHEFVLFAHKGRPKLKSERIPDVIDCEKIQGQQLLHPTEKPVQLMETFIRQSSDAGGVVLDPFMGSGATAVACGRLERNFIGFELDKEYHRIANERIGAVQLSLII